MPGQKFGCVHEGGETAKWERELEGVVPVLPPSWGEVPHLVSDQGEAEAGKAVELGVVFAATCSDWEVHYTGNYVQVEREKAVAAKEVV